MAIMKFCAHDDWKEISDGLEGKNLQDCQVSPFMVDKALLRFGDGRVLRLEWVNGKWRKIRNIHVKTAKWSFEKHSTNEVVVGYAGRVRICGLPSKF